MSNLYKASFEDICEDFDKLFDDIDKLYDLEAQSLNAILEKRKIKTILDCACGTGIQTIGLARLGYKLFASDISPKMVLSTRKKALKENLDVRTKVSDFTNLKEWKDIKFDAVINCGNSIPLLPDIENVVRSLKSMISLLKKNGMIMISIHNYLKLKERGKIFLLRGNRSLNGDQETVFDTRNFGKDRVIVTNFFIKKYGDRKSLKTYIKSYMYLKPEILIKKLTQLGIRNIEVLDLVGLKKFSDQEWYLLVGEK